MEYKANITRAAMVVLYDLTKQIVLIYNLYFLK
jgi:hypothetical protein